MFRINTFKLLMCCIAFVLSACTTTKKKLVTVSEIKPNILFVLCDDLGYADVGFNGSPDIKTPNLDALANKGTIFKSAYVTHPFCGPSRASIMTGRYPHTIGSQFNLPPNSEIIGEGIDVNEKFISSTLQDAGYYTGALGKWHLGAVEKYHPNNRGFDDFYGFLGGGHNYFPEQFMKAYEIRKKAGNKHIFEYLLPLEHNGEEVVETEYVTDALSREAVRFVNDAAKTKKPFFLYLSYNAPHTPLEAKKEDLKLFESINDEKRRTYAAMVYAVDRGVKKVVEALKETKQLENTLIIFLSDNGGRLDQGANNFPLKEGKGSTYEGGFRVPMFFYWPKHIAAGKYYNYPVSSLDFYPTLSYLAGASISKDKILDGKNIWKNIQENSNARFGEPIFAMRHQKGFTDAAIRIDEWKALKIHRQHWKLFNIENDISETIDLSLKHPEILTKLVKQSKDWSTTHSKPLWFHSEKTGKDWESLNMPDFDTLFQIEK
ncbi:sulfatase-like hydrolase/transferase [Lutibacter sp. A80]|uniref:sulfatase-like hydrolase/transferase n=1 Tax=Lutibacter sp. A80 TaxID=2918453 RepID=UPI001F053F1B|nr:sulfatase-like hydrolase/transferase [Lutibacter sp. A80]UMB61708.1 sulfatase-like hydrolase/transferase [Lutibacter sp. A80]